MTLAIAQGGEEERWTVTSVLMSARRRPSAPLSPRVVSSSPTITYVPRASRSLLESRDSGEFRDNFPPMLGSVVDASKYGPLESGLYFG